MYLTQKFLPLPVYIKIYWTFINLLFLSHYEFNLSIFMFSLRKNLDLQLINPKWTRNMPRGCCRQWWRWRWRWPWPWRPRKCTMMFAIIWRFVCLKMIDFDDFIITINRKVLIIIFNPMFFFLEILENFLICCELKF